jgi:myo-inositol-1(or 4)-monophosphatase
MGTMIDIDAALEVACEIAIAGGKLALDRQLELATLVIDQKSPGDIVTSADREVEEMLRSILADRFPHHAVFGEEGGGALNGLCWILDPIDGTSNFARAAPFWCVSVALFDGNRPVIGAVHDPNLGETFAAAAGRGATCNGAPIACAYRDTLDDATIGFGFTRKRPSNLTLETLHAVTAAGAHLRAQGAGALTLSHIAAGRLDGFFEAHIHLWDIAAAALILSEAGGWSSCKIDWQAPAAGFPIIAGGAGLQMALTDACRAIYI